MPRLPGRGPDGAGLTRRQPSRGPLAGDAGFPRRWGREARGGPCEDGTVDPSQPPTHARAHAHARAHSHGHGHGHGPVPPVSKHLRRVVAAILVPFAAAVAVGLIVLWPGGAPSHARSGVGFDQQTQRGSVTALADVSCRAAGAAPAQPPPGGTASDACQKATIEVTSGPDKGATFTQIVQPDQTRRYERGEDLVLTYAPNAPPGERYSVGDVARGLPMGVLAALFALAVIVVGRMRGVMALVSLAVSFGVLSRFVLPGILRGGDPLLLAVVGGSAILLVSLYLCHGLNARTSVAVIGTLCSLFLIGVLGSAFIDWAHLTGDTSEETGLIHSLYPHIRIRGILLAGVVIGSLGVLNDVTVTQTSAVWELKAADPAANWRALHASGMRIGRDHIASVVNTLVLAYAGAALPLLLLFSIAHSGVGRAATSELVAEEIVRTLVGSIGLIASVPLTTLLAALVVSADRPPPAGGQERPPALPAARRGSHRRRAS